MKRSIGDIFKREYEVRLSVNSRDTVSPSSEQQKGIALLSAEEDKIFSSGNTAAIEETFALIREVQPEVLRFFAESPAYNRWLSFCSKEGISPHLVFSSDASSEQLRTAAAECVSEMERHDLQQLPRYYEIAFSTDGVSLGDDGEINARVMKMKSCAEQLRAADPEGKIILGGITPDSLNAGRAEAWNTVLMEQCAGVMDLLGVTLFPQVPAGRTWNEDSDGIEAGFALAEEIRSTLQRLERQISRTAADSGIRLAVTGWGPLQDDTRQKRQDCLFFSSVYKALRMGRGMIGLFEAGPLFGRNGLLRFEEGKVFGDVFYHNMLITSDDLPVCLEVKEAEYEKPCPAYHYEGLPGTFDGADIKLLDCYASRSTDGKKLYLLLTNRTPFRRAVPRIRFYDLSDMHPAQACSMRSPKRLDENSASAPLNVYCKDVKLRKYRNMDHVTLDILQCSTVCMVLEQ